MQQKILRIENLQINYRDFANIAKMQNLNLAKFSSYTVVMKGSVDHWLATKTRSLIKPGLYMN